jgi:hypothetical protein
MANYISPKQEYPRHDGDIQLSNPEWSVGQPLPLGWIEVFPTPSPPIGKNQIAYEVFPVEANGVWIQTWEVRDLTAEEIETRKVAEVKNKIAIGEPITEAEALLLVG